MIRKTTFRILLVFALSVLFVVGLYWTSIVANRRISGGFVRLFPSHAIGIIKSLDLKYNSYYLAGLSRATIYLGNYSSRNYVLKSDFNLSDTQSILFRTVDRYRLAVKVMKVEIDSPSVYFTEGITPALLQSNIRNEEERYYKFHNRTFSASWPISSSSVILRTYSTKLRKSTITKENILAPAASTTKDILEKQVDGIFCTDGKLIYNKAVGKIFYVYSYRNDFLCLDTNLNVLYKAKTIDTISHVKISVSRIESLSKTTLSSPPLLVNKLAYADDKWLYINSGLQASNEDEKKFNRNSVIDVYSTATGEYHCSFYVPFWNKTTMKEFRVHDTVLVALYDKDIVTFNLSLK